MPRSLASVRTIAHLHVRRWIRRHGARRFLAVVSVVVLPLWWFSIRSVTGDPRPHPAGFRHAAGIGLGFGSLFVVQIAALRVTRRDALDDYREMRGLVDDAPLFVGVVLGTAVRTGVLVAAIAVVPVGLAAWKLSSAWPLLGAGIAAAVLTLTATAVGTVLGLGARLAPRVSFLDTTQRLAVVVMAALVWLYLERVAAFLAGLPTDALGTLVGARSPTAVAPFAWLVLAVCLVALGLCLVVGTRLARAHWRSGNRRTLDALGSLPTLGRTPARTVARTTLARALRNPALVGIAFLAILVNAAVWRFGSPGGKTAAVVLDAAVAAALVAPVLNPLGSDGRTLPVTLLAPPTTHRAQAHGRMLAAVAIYGLLLPVHLALFVLLAGDPVPSVLVACVLGAGFTAGLAGIALWAGSVLPHSDGADPLRSDPATAARRAAYLVVGVPALLAHALVTPTLYGLALPGTPLARLAAMALLVGCLGAYGSYRYANRLGTYTV